MNKAKLIYEWFSEAISGERIKYGATMHLPSGENVTYNCIVEGPDQIGIFRIRLTMCCDSWDKNKRCDVVLSKFYGKTNSVKLEMIEIPEEYRRLGLASIAFQSWIKVVEKIVLLYKNEVKIIYGTIGTTSSLTPKNSRKLYKRFHNYRCFETRKLKLNYIKLYKNELEYMIV